MIGSPGPTKRALLIGIDQYPLFPAERQLQGCVNDIQALGGLLAQRFGFAPAHMNLLRNGAATQAGIRAAFSALVAATGPNDLLVIHYSGHGSQMTDREGDEPDGLDSTIVPHDSGRGDQPNRDITDDEIYLWLRALARHTPFVTCIFDSCHSGSITRDAFAAAARWVAPDRRPVAALPPSPAPGIAAARPVGAAVGTSGWLPPDEQYVLLAGCRDDESSYEYPRGARQHGALTYFLLQELAQAAPGATYRDVFAGVSAQVTGANSAQHPQLEGAADREIFGVRDMVPMRFVPVSARNGSTVTLGAGEAQGLTTGSRWAIYPPATKQVTPQVAPLGEVTIAAVQVVTATAQVNQEAAPGAIVAASRAVIRGLAAGDPRLKVAVQAPDAARHSLAPGVAASPLLALAPQSAADVCVYLLPVRRQAGPQDPVPQVPQVPQPTWVIVGADGQPAAALHPAAEPDVGNLLVANLEKLAQYRAALAIRNQAASSVLQGQVTLRLLRRAADGRWQPAIPAAGGYLLFRVGEKLDIEVANRSAVSVYPTIVDFGLTGAVSPIYPRDGSAEEWMPGRVQRLYGDAGGIEVRMDDFPFVPVVPGTPVRRTEVVKLFVTTAPTDFSPLFHTGTMAVMPPSRDPLTQLLTLALSGAGMRNLIIDVMDAAPTADWITSEAPFVVEKGP